MRKNAVLSAGERKRRVNTEQHLGASQQNIANYLSLYGVNPPVGAVLEIF
jgi:hypothetical protein